MTDRVPYQHYVHPWIADEDDDDFGMTVPACRCGGRRSKGEHLCAGCLSRIAEQLSETGTFPPTQIPPKGAGE